MKRAWVIAAVLVVALAGGVLAGGCDPEQARDAGERAAGNSQENQQNADQQNVDQREITAQPERVLEDKWYVDSDGNEVPDFIEVEEGYDPEVDDCAEEVDCPGPSGASGGAGLITREQNTLLILDSSGSMAEQTGVGETKMVVAKDALERYVTGTPDFVNLGFMVYGHQGSSEEADKAESCEGIELLDPLGEVDYQSFPQTLESFRPTGWTPIAGSLEQAKEAFSGKKDADNRVILVTDGLETCGGDPVAAARSLDGADISVTVDVVGFDIATSEEQQALRQIAEATGGEYYDAQTGADLEDYFSEQRRIVSELTDQYLCAQNYRNNVGNCMINFSNETVGSNIGNKIISAIRRNAEKERDAIKEIQTDARNYLEEERKAVKAANEERIAKIREDLKEAQQRMRERYNEDVSFTPSCPNSTVYASLEKEIVLAKDLKLLTQWLKVVPRGD